MKNDWNSFLTGKANAFNFSYNSELPHEPEPAPPSIPAPQAHIPSPTPNNVVPPKNNKAKLPLQNGGKRKSRRVRRTHKKYRVSHRTHRK